MTVTCVRLCEGGPSVSRLVYGMWRLADEPHGGERFAVRERIDACLSRGISTFDHADIYGGYLCEELFGQALREAPALRESMQLITKCDICLPLEGVTDYRIKHYDTSAAHLSASVERSLSRLATDYVDVLLLHRPDPLMDADEVATCIRSLMAQGKVRHVGVSNFRPHQFRLLESRLETPLVTNQVELSVLCTDSMTDGVLDQCQERRIRPMAWSPLSGGALFGDAPRARRVRAALSAVAEQVGVSPDTLAYAWLLRHPSGVVPVLGSGKLDRIDRAVAALDVTLDREQWFRVYEAALGEEVP